MGDFGSPVGVAGKRQRSLASKQLPGTKVKTNKPLCSFFTGCLRSFANALGYTGLTTEITQDYPNLVTFLEKYYDYLDSDGASSFDYKLRKIYQTRDTQETSSDLLKFIIQEITAGNTGGNFIDPSFYAQRIHELHRT